MRRRSGFLVRLFNLVYLVAAGISIYAFCTRPIFKASLNVSLSKTQVSSLVSKAFNRDGGDEGDRLIYRESETRDMKDYFTKERIETYFPNGLKVNLPIEITAKQAFDIKNTHLLDDLIQLNLGGIVDNVYNVVINPITSLFKDIVTDFGVDSLTEQINKQIEENFPDGAPATAEEVQAVFDNVYSLLDGDEPVSVDTLANVILYGTEGENNGVLSIINARGSKYEPWDPQPTEEEVTSDLTAAEGEEKYFVRSISYSHNKKDYDSSAIYYAQISPGVFEECDPQPTAEEVEADKTAEEGFEIYFVKVANYSHNTEAYDSSTTYYEKKPYTNEDIDNHKIAEQMADALEGIDGLVTKVPHICDPQPTEEEVVADLAKEESERIYYVLDANGNPVLPDSYDTSATYYTVEKVVNDIDTALTTLVDSLLNKGESNDNRAIVRAEEPHVDSQNEPKSISENIKAYLYGMIPQNITEKAGVVGQKAPFILLALIALFALPWVWFALVTFVRTFRRDKCWTRPMIILFWCLPQVIFGLGLTYSLNYLFPYFASKIDALKDYANSVNFDIRTGCLIPSFVYLGVAAMTLVYWIIRSPLKRQYKILKHFGYYGGRIPHNSAQYSFNEYGDGQPIQDRQPQPTRAEKLARRNEKPEKPKPYERQPVYPYNEQPGYPYNERQPRIERQPREFNGAKVDRAIKLARRKETPETSMRSFRLYK